MDKKGVKGTGVCEPPDKKCFLARLTPGAYFEFDLQIQNVSIEELFDERLLKRGAFKETLETNRDIIIHLAAHGPEGFISS